MTMSTRVYEGCLHVDLRMVAGCAFGREAHALVHVVLVPAFPSNCASRTTLPSSNLFTSSSGNYGNHGSR